MPPTKPPASKPPFPAGLFLTGAVFAIIGWVGVAGVVFLTLPFLLPRWLFFFSLFLAITGTATPVVWYLNRRFTPARFPSEGILIRETLETASLGVFLVWLQAGRLFTVFLGWAFFGAFLAVELLLRLYENSRWTPAPSIDEQTSEANGEQTGSLPSGDSSAGE
ncbi:MAG: hypothetical protein ABSC61_01660 [Anaerolineales bacterium]